MIETPLCNPHDLKRGDIIRNLGSGESYVVLREGVPGNPTKSYPVAVRDILVSNPTEWVVVTGRPEGPQQDSLSPHEYRMRDRT